MVRQREWNQNNLTNSKRIKGGVMKDKVVESAESMAMETFQFTPRYKRYRYRIADNPYKWHKKNSVVWHNAFYDKCREIGRHI